MIWWWHFEFRVAYIPESLARFWWLVKIRSIGFSSILLHTKSTSITKTEQILRLQKKKQNKKTKQNKKRSAICSLWCCCGKPKTTTWECHNACYNHLTLQFELLKDHSSQFFIHNIKHSGQSRTSKMKLWMAKVNKSQY